MKQSFCFGLLSTFFFNTPFYSFLSCLVSIPLPVLTTSSFDYYFLLNKRRKKKRLFWFEDSLLLQLHLLSSMKCVLIIFLHRYIRFEGQIMTWTWTQVSVDLDHFSLHYYHQHLHNNCYIHFS